MLDVALEEAEDDVSIIAQHCDGHRTCLCWRKGFVFATDSLAELVHLLQLSNSLIEVLRIVRVDSLRVCLIVVLKSLEGALHYLDALDGSSLLNARRSNG